MKRMGHSRDELYMLPAMQLIGKYIYGEYI